MSQTPSSRGRDCFLPIVEYSYEAWAKKRRKIDTVVELAVGYAIPDVAPMVLTVEQRQMGRPPVLIYKR